MIKDDILCILQKEFQPAHLLVEDDSARHAGHAGTPNPSQGETHFCVTICSEQFSGKTRIERHQLIYSALDQLFRKTDIHALQIRAFSPAEWKLQR